MKIPFVRDTPPPGRDFTAPAASGLTIRAKTLVLVAGVLVVMLGGVLALTDRFAMEGFRDLERREARGVFSHMTRALQREAEELHSFATDWATRDETYGFVRDRAPSFIAKNIEKNAVFTESRVDALAIFDETGAYVWGGSFGRAKEVNAASLPGFTARATPNSVLVEMAEHNSALAFVNVSGAPMLVAAIPILTTSGKGPSRGILVIGRRIGNDEIRRFKEQVLADVRIVMSGDSGSADHTSAATSNEESNPDIRFVSDERTTVSDTFQDVYGTPLFTVELSMDRPAYIYAARTNLKLMLVLVGGGLLILFSVWLALDRTLLKRVRLLGSRVRAIQSGDDLAEKNVSIPGRDEIGVLSEDITAMVRAIQRTRKIEQERERLAVARALLDSIPAYAYMKDTMGRYLVVNKRFARAVGKERESVIGLRDDDILPAEVASPYREAEKRALSNCRTEDFEGLWSDAGRSMTVHSRLTPILHSPGKPFAVVGILMEDSQPSQKANH